MLKWPFSVVLLMFAPPLFNTYVWWQPLHNLSSFWHLSTLLHWHFGQQPLAGQLASIEHCHSEQKSFIKVPDFGGPKLYIMIRLQKTRGLFSCPNLTPKQSGLFVTQRNTLKLHPNKSGRTPLMNFGQNAIAAYWESRTIRDQRWKLKIQQLLSVWPSQWASAQCRPLDSQPLERNQTSSLPRLMNQSIQKKLIDGHSIRPDGNPSVHFYESFCWEGVWLSIIQYGSITITMSGDKKIYLTNCARHHTLQRCWHNLHSGILRMSLSTKGKEDVEQNLSLTITSFTASHQTWPTLGCLSEKRIFP